MVDKSPSRRSSRASSASFSTRASRRQTQLLCRPRELGDLDLGHAVLAHQGMDDPGFFPLLGATAGLVEPVDGRLGQTLVGLQEPGTEGLQAEGPRGGETLETVEDLVRLLAEADDHGSELSIALERSGHGGLGVGVGQAIASIALAQLGQGQEADIAGMPVSHGGPRHHAPNSEQGNGGPDRPGPPASSSVLGGKGKLFLRGWHPQYVTT